MTRHHHKHLTLERWAQFSLAQRILMIATELYRANEHLQTGDSRKAVFDLERAFELLDLTKQDLALKAALRLELGRLREMLGKVYVEKEQDLLNQLYRALLSMDREAFNAVGVPCSRNRADAIGDEGKSKGG